RRLLADGHGQHAGDPGAERNEAHVAEGEDAGVADEHVERDDDRHLHERVDEVPLGRLRDERADERRGDDEGGGRRELHDRRETLHTRSVGCLRVKSPFGRTSSTRMTAAKRNVGKYWLWFVGSAPPRMPLAKPIEKPPSVAGIGRFRPPSTTPASTTIVSRSAKSGVTSGFCTVSITATTAASTPETRTAPP